MLINRALHAQMIAAGDPTVSPASASRALARRVGFGTGEEIADGHWSEAIELEAAGRGRLRERIASIEPQERIAEILGARGTLLASETLIARARHDFDRGAARESALQLIVGIDALLGEIAYGASAETDADLDAISNLRPQVGSVATASIAGEPGPESLESLTRALKLCERALRRRSAGL